MFKKTTYNLNLEGLRGFAALSVGFSHLFVLRDTSRFWLDPDYHPEGYLSYLADGHGAVLIFFVLSGYVIGMTNQSSFSQRQANKYLARRAVRLLPIYIISVLFASVLSSNNNLSTVLGNLFFLQNSLGPISTINSDLALWSLNYEIIYYLIFIVIWWLKPKISLLICFSLLLSVLGCLRPSDSQIIPSYASGWLFWLSGLWQGKRKKNGGAICY